MSSMGNNKMSEERRDKNGDTAVQAVRRRWDALPERGEPVMPFYYNELIDLEDAVAERDTLRKTIQELREIFINACGNGNT